MNANDKMKPFITLRTEGIPSPEVDPEMRHPDLGVEEDIPLRPSLRADPQSEIVMALTTRVTEIRSETRDDR